MALKRMFHGRMLTEWALITIVAFLFYDVIWLITDDDSVLDNFNNNGGYIAIDFAYCAFFSFLILWISMRIAHIGYFSKLTYRRQLLLSLVTLASNMLVAALLEWLYDILILAPYDTFASGLVIACFLATLASMVHNMQYYSRIIAEQNAHSISIEKKMMKMHLDPHFVFNNLNILACLVKTNPDDAEKFIILLSKVYRHIISSIDKDVTSLYDALDFARRYVEVLNVRFRNKINLQIDTVPEQIRNEGILTSSLHLLIENAVKHNMPEGATRLTITIIRKDNRLMVRNNIISNGSKSTIPSLGIGLKNLQERYRLQCGELPEIHQTVDYYEVLLPLLPIEE